jgi:membrane associated rhomboid family serine protease
MNSLLVLLNTPTIGASGAVFGVLLAFGMLFPNTQLMIIFPPIPIRAKYFVLIYGVLELVLAFTQPGSNIAHFAHLGGMLFGYLLIRYWRKTTNTLY